MNGIRMTSAQHVKDVLTETIRLLCRTGLRYQHCLKIQGLLGITVDDDQILLIHMNDNMLAASINSDLSNGLNLPDESSSRMEIAHQQTSVNTPELCETSKSNCHISRQQSVLPREPFNDETVACSTYLSSEANSGAISTSVDCMCPKTEVPYCHSEGCHYVIPTEKISYDSSASKLMQEDQEDTVSLPHGGTYPFVATEYSEKEVNSLPTSSCSTDPQPTPDDEVNKIFVVKTPSLTSCAILDMSTDVHEEQVVTEDVPSAPSLDHCFLPYSTSPTTTCLAKLETVRKAEDDILSENSYSDDSDDDNNDCNMSESDNMSNGQLTQSQALSGEAQSGIRQWAPGVQQSLSEPYSAVGGAAWNLSPGLLGGVLPAGGPHSAAYYQQQILAAAAAAAHNRAARAAAARVQSPTPAVLNCSVKSDEQLPASKMSPGSRRLPRRPRESVEKRFRCPYCELAYYHKKHLKYHLAKKHSL